MLPELMSHWLLFCCIFCVKLLGLLISKENWLKITELLFFQWCQIKSPVFLKTKDWFCFLKCENGYQSQISRGLYVLHSLKAQAIAGIDLLRYFVAFRKSQLLSQMLRIDTDSATSLMQGDSHRPLIVISAHFLGVELMLMHLSQLRLGACVVSPPNSGEGSSGGWGFLSQQLGPQVLRADRVFNDGIKLLRQNKALALLIDVSPSASEKNHSFKVCPAHCLVGVARTVLTLARRTGARLIWATAYQRGPGEYVGHLQEFALSDLGATEATARAYFADRIKAHLQQYGWHQLAWGMLNNPPELST